MRERTARTVRDVEKVSEDVGLPMLLSVQRVAELLGVSRSKVYELIAARELEAYRPGGRLRVTTGAVAALLEKTRV